MCARPKCVLVEDNEQNRYLITYLLQNGGFDVVAAETGPKGLSILPESDAEIILLDIQLPGMDGYELAREIKRDPRYAQVPVVAISSFAMPGDRAKAANAGFDGYIEKPIDPDTFVAEIKSFLRRQ